MKTNSNSKLLFAGVMAFAFIGLAGISSLHEKDNDKKKPWNIPESSKQVKNPVKADKESLAAGKTLFNKHCKSCHGAKGLGDGPKAAELKTSCSDFSTGEFQSQTDGEIYYKTREGRDDMPSYKKKIPEAEDIWAVVNFIRTLGKTAADK